MRFSARLWVGAALLGAMVCWAQAPALAQKSEGSVLFLAPHRLIIAPDSKSETISVSNKSTEERRYDLMMIDQVMNENGITQQQDTFSYSIKRMVRFQPKRFTLKPGESQVVRVVVDRPNGITDGDYHSHLLFREVPLSMKDKSQLEQEHADSEKKAVSFEIRTLYGVAVPIVVQVGKVVEDISATDMHLGTSAGDSKMRTLAATFNRTGNSEAVAKVTVEYAAPGKAPVAVMDPQWVRIYREVDKISKVFELPNLPADAKDGKLVVSLVKDENDPKKTVQQDVSLK